LPTASENDRQPLILEVDGLRGIAIALVLFCHYSSATLVYRPRTLLSYLFVPGRLAWSCGALSFVLSGLLIGWILLEAKKSSNYFKVFYTRRFLRIVPIFGVFSAVLLRSKRWSQRIGTSGYWFPGFLLCLFAAAAILTKINAGVTTLKMASFGYTCLTALYAYLLLSVCARPRNLLAAIARWRPLRWLGSISYGAYLFHQPIQGLAFALIRRGEPRIENGSTLVLSLVALALAYVSRNFFEARVVKLSHRARYEFLPRGEILLSAAVPASARQ